MTSVATSNNPYGLPTWAVTTPGGSELNVQTNEEAVWYEQQRDRYQAQNRFPNVSDLQDLDRLLVLELLVHRWSIWMGQGWDYVNARVDEKQLKDNIREYSVEIRQLKSALGIDKVNRDKDKGDSLPDYLATLLERAREFGYHRNNQYSEAVTRIYELRSLVATFDRCDERERAELDLSHESIFAWIRDNLIKPWDEIDEAFRKDQAMWVKTL